MIGLRPTLRSYLIMEHKVKIPKGTKFAIIFEPFEDEGYEYVREGNPWTVDSPVKLFTDREEAEKEKRKWTTGVVTIWGQYDPAYYDKEK